MTTHETASPAAEAWYAAAFEFFTIEHLGIRRRLRWFNVAGSALGIGLTLVLAAALVLGGKPPATMVPTLLLFVCAFLLGLLGFALRTRNVFAVETRLARIAEQVPHGAVPDRTALDRRFRAHQLPLMRGFALASIVFENAVGALVICAYWTGGYAVLTF